MAEERADGPAPELCRYDREAEWTAVPYYCCECEIDFMYVDDDLRPNFCPNCGNKFETVSNPEPLTPNSGL